MKVIPLRKLAEISSVDVLRTVLENAPTGVNAGEMRKRVRVLDALDLAVKLGADAVMLEDADHATLRNAVEGFPFAKATRDLLSIVDDVCDAKAPPKAEEAEAA